MSEPVVFISHFAIKPGAADGLQLFLRDGSAALERDKPRTLAFLPFADEAGSELSIVHVFGDRAAMDEHFEGSDERSNAAYEYIEPRGWEIYGRPSDGTLMTLRQAADSAGVPLTVHPAREGGFLRA
jgi:hypothetical protein